MRCPKCGADLRDEAFLCPNCGAEPGLSLARKTGCRRLLPLVWVGLAFLFAAGLLALAVWRGALEGKEQWQNNAEGTADAEFARCQTFMAEEKWMLAQAACREAARLKPEYGQAANYLFATAVVALTPELTPTIIVTQRSAQDAFADAQVLYNAQDWRGALETLNELWKLDSAFQAEERDRMRHTALVSLGRQALDEGLLEQAIYYLDQAVSLASLDPELEFERQLAALYVSALNFCGVDWAECTTRLANLYATYPNYRDVYNQLVDAYLGWAEAMANLQEWCPADIQYGQALQLRADTAVDAKQVDAAQKCLLATPTPIPGQITGTITLTVEGFTVGRLVYSAYNGDLGLYEIYLLSAYDQRLSKMVSNAGQPQWQRDGGMLAYRGVAGLQALVTGGSSPIMLVGDSTTFWPTLSPDGTRVAYARQEADGWRIYVAKIDGSAAPQPLALGKYPLWSPQGPLAFSGCVLDGIARGICAVDPDDPAAVPVPLTANPNDTPTGWSPDGFNIAYMSDHGGDWDTYLVNMSGGVVLLTADDEAPASDGLPTWAPDGSAIAFISNRAGTWDLYLMSPDGGNVRQVLNIGAQHPNWLIERLSWAP